jgi:cephalosporin-C deacetylase-like acetyl esterase
MDSREEYVARDWYAALVRTNDYLASRPDLADMTRIVVAGGSQGGAFAIVTAALDPRVAYCFADCPAMGLPHEMMKHYMSYGPSRGQAPPGIEVEELERLLSYYDPVNFAPYITCPTHVGSNIGDITVHSMGPLAIYKNLTGLKSDQKAFHAGFTHMHGSGFGLAENQKQILDGLASSPP